MWKQGRFQASGQRPEQLLSIEISKDYAIIIFLISIKTRNLEIYQNVCNRREEIVFHFYII